MRDNIVIGLAIFGLVVLVLWVAVMVWFFAVLLHDDEEPLP